MADRQYHNTHTCTHTPAPQLSGVKADGKKSAENAAPASELTRKPCRDKQDTFKAPLFLSVAFALSGLHVSVKCRHCKLALCSFPCFCCTPDVHIRYRIRAGAQSSPASGLNNLLFFFFCLTTASSRGGAHMQKATWKGLLVAVSFYYALRCHVC